MPRWRHFFPGLLLPKSKLNTSQVQDRRRHAGFSTKLIFAFFGQFQKQNWTKISPKTWKSPGHATLHTCRVEECRGSLPPQSTVAQEKPASIEPNHVYDQRDLNIVTQKTDPKVSCVHTLTYSKEHLKLKCQFQTAKCKIHRLNPL